MNDCQKEIDRLKSIIKTNKELFATFSHDIRNFVNSVLGFLDLLALQEENPNKFEYIKSAQNAVTLILNLVNDVVELSKIEEGKLKINEYFYIPIDEFKSVYRIFYSSAVNKNILFLGFFDPLLPYAIKGDDYRVKQIISNLLSNAIKFTPEGGIIKFHINYKRKTNTIEFTISDSGIGMDKEELERLFKPFEQANDIVAAQFGGSGLGMNIVYKLVEMMGGSIKVRSKKGKGTTFKVSLPCKTYNFIPPTVEKEEFSDYNFVLVKDDDKLNEAVFRLVMRYFRRLGIDFEVISKKEMFEYLKKDKDYIIIIPDVNNGLCSEDFCNKEILNTNKKIILIKRINNFNYSLPDNVKVLPIPFIGGSLFKTIKKSFKEIKKEQKETKKSEKILSVLVVDDNPINLKIMRELLKSLNMVPFLAQEEYEVMDILNSKNIDAVFVDEQMPKVSGSELIKKIKSYPKFKNIKIFGLIGDIKEETKNRLLEAGAEDVLIKPISREKLQSLFESF